MVRYSGIFSAHARGRYALTGRGMRDAPDAPSPPTTDGMGTGQPALTVPPALPSPAPSQPAPGVTAPDPRVAPSSSKHAVPLPPSSCGTYDGPDDLARERRLDWAALLKRTHLIDVLVCPKCAGPMRLIAFVQDERVARRILEHLGLWSPRAPPRPERASRSRESVLVLDLDAIDPQFLD